MYRLRLTEGFLTTTPEAPRGHQETGSQHRAEIEWALPICNRYAKLEFCSNKHAVSGNDRGKSKKQAIAGTKVVWHPNAAEG